MIGLKLIDPKSKEGQVISLNRTMIGLKLISEAEIVEGKFGLNRTMIGLKHHNTMKTLV